MNTEQTSENIFTQIIWILFKNMKYSTKNTKSTDTSASFFQTSHQAMGNWLISAETI